METVFTFWLKSPLDTHTIESMKSWLRLGYEVNLYTYDKNLSYHNKNVNIKFAGDILPLCVDLSIHEMADYFRFVVLSKGVEKTWIDSDLLLLKRLPDTADIVSSEDAQRKGAFKPKNRNFTPNIGVIRLTSIEGRELLIKTTDYMSRIVNSSKVVKSLNNNFLMKKFQKLVLNSNIYISPPQDYCPISWCYFKDIYRKVPEEKLKYDIPRRTLDESYGIHLWRQLVNRHFLEVEKGSLYDRLTHEPLICIPTHNRKIILGTHTLAFLERHNYDNFKIFVNDNKQRKLLNNISDHQIEITNTQGIADCRRYILNKYNNDEIVMMDDDIIEVNRLVNGEYGPIDNFTQWVRGMFDKSRQIGARLWGVPLNNNGFFKKEYCIQNLTYIGALQGFRTSPELEEVYSPYDHYEDMIYSLGYYLRDGLLLKDCSVGLDSKWFNNTGGINSTLAGGKKERYQIAELLAKKIEDAFPEHVKAYKKKKFKVWNLKCRQLKKRDNSFELFSKFLEDSQNY
jgi:hypothetical protein